MSCYGLFGCDDGPTDGHHEQNTLDLIGEAVEKSVPSNRCCICSSENVKYRCPSCGFRSCSLSCVNQHKKKDVCDGKRKRIPYAKMEEFTQKHLVDDYFFLDDINSAVDASIRSRRNIIQSLPQLPKWLVKIRLEARMRGTRLKILPAGFEKRKTNKTMFHYKEKCLFWTLEMIFESTDHSNPEDLVIFDGRVKEHLTLTEILKSHLYPADPFDTYDRIKRLSDFRSTNLSDLCVFLKLESKGHLKVDVSLTLQKCLEGKTITEYPTFLVVMPQNQDKYHQATSSDKKDSSEKTSSSESDSDDE